MPKARQLLRMLTESAGSIPRATKEERTRVDAVIVCPVCHAEIGEKASGWTGDKTPSGEMIHQHGFCKGKFLWPEATDIEKRQMAAFEKRWSAQ